MDSPSSTAVVTTSAATATPVAEVKTTSVESSSMEVVVPSAASADELRRELAEVERERRRLEQLISDIEKRSNPNAAATTAATAGGSAAVTAGAASTFGADRFDRRPKRNRDGSFSSPSQRISSVVEVIPAIDSTADAESDHVDKRRKLTLSASKPAKPEIDETEKRRSRNLFSNLLQGTLMQFKKDSSKDAPVLSRRRELEKKVDHSLKEDLEKNLDVHRARCQEKRERERELRKQLSVIRQARARDAVLTAHKTNFETRKKFLQTKTEPRLYYLPAKHNDKTEQLLAEAIQQVWIAPEVSFTRPTRLSSSVDALANVDLDDADHDIDDLDDAEPVVKDDLDEHATSSSSPTAAVADMTVDTTGGAPSASTHTTSSTLDDGTNKSNNHHTSSDSPSDGTHDTTTTD